MAKLSRLGNGNVFIVREAGEENISEAELRAKVAPELGVKLGNGNIYIVPLKPAGSEGLEPAAAVATAGGPNPDFDPAARDRELQELLEALEAGDEGLEGANPAAAGVQTSTEPPAAPLEPWALQLTPATYLRRYGVWAAHSERALAHMGVTAEQFCELLGIKMPPKPEPAEEPAGETE